MQPSEEEMKQNVPESSEKSLLQLNDDCLEKIFSNFSVRELMELEQVCSHFQIITGYCYKRERVLEIVGGRHSRKDVADLAVRLGPHVTTLKISDRVNTSVRQFNDVDDLLPLWINCTSLEHLIIMDTGLMIHLEFLKTVFKNLKSVKLIECQFTDEIGECLKTASKLVSLSLAGNRSIDGSFLPDLKDQLKEIDLRKCENIIDGPYFRDFCKKNLKLESLAFGFYSRHSMEHLAELKNLRCLKIEHIEFYPSSSDVIPDLPKLTRLQIKGTLMVCSFHRVLERLASTLEYFSIYASHCDDLDKILKKFTKIKVLKITRGSFDPSIISMDCRMILENLRIYGSDVTDEGLLKFLKDCPNIRKLDVRRCKKITDALIIGLLDILKERPHTLEIFVAETEISESIEDKLEIQGNRMIKLNWTRNFYNYTTLTF